MTPTHALDRLLGPVADCLTPEAAGRLIHLQPDPEVQARIEELATQAWRRRGLQGSYGMLAPTMLHRRRNGDARNACIGTCKIVRLERVRCLTIHHVRHTFISHALAGGRTLAEVKTAAGHSSLVTTSAYLHVAIEARA